LGEPALPHAFALLEKLANGPEQRETQDAQQRGSERADDQYRGGCAGQAGTQEKGPDSRSEVVGWNRPMMTRVQKPISTPMKRFMGQA